LSPFECHECQIKVASALGVGVFVRPRHPATGLGDLARRGNPGFGGTASSLSPGPVQPGCAPWRIQCRDGCRRCGPAKANMKNTTNLGAVTSVRGSVVDIRFDEHLPPIYSLLHAGDGAIAIEVLAQLDAHRVRGIALTTTQGLVRGSAVQDTGGPLKAPVGKGTLSRMFDVFGNAIDRQAAPTDVQRRTVHRAPPALARRTTKSEIFETGIKVIDVLVPLERGGKAGLFG